MDAWSLEMGSHRQARGRVGSAHMALTVVGIFVIAGIFLPVLKVPSLSHQETTCDGKGSAQVAILNGTVDEGQSSASFHDESKNITLSRSLQKTPYSLAKRDKDSLPWEDAVAKGDRLWTALGATRKETFWTTMGQLTGPKDASAGTGAGWVLDTMSGSVYKTLGYTAAYEDLEISPNDDERWFVNQYHNFANSEFEDLEMTGAQYVNLFNVPGRTIIAAHNTSPAAAIDKDEVVEINGQAIPWQQRLPDIQKWSDVVGITWTDKAGDQAHKLKYIFRQAIVTPTTLGIINGVVHRQKENIPSYQDGFRWPGFKVLPRDEDFKALLGTPHGSGVAFLLLEHPVELPNKQIESVQIFLTQEDGQYHMLWTLSDD